VVKKWTCYRNFHLEDEAGENLPACDGIREIFMLSNTSSTRNWISPDGFLYSYKVQ
jgi:hypothetical protein